MASGRLPVAVLLSGTGRTLKNLIERARQGLVPIEIRLVISSHPDALGQKIAAEAGIPTEVVERRQHATIESFSQAVFQPCRQAEVGLVIMAGFLKQVLVPPEFVGRVINIHPALLPSFGGKGFYGIRVHEAVLASGTRVTGCTVHYVDDEYDHGEILLQRHVPVLEDDNPETLAARVFAAECEALPEAVTRLAREWQTKAR